MRTSGNIDVLWVGNWKLPSEMKAGTASGSFKKAGTVPVPLKLIPPSLVGERKEFVRECEYYRQFLREGYETYPAFFWCDEWLA